MISSFMISFYCNKNTEFKQKHYGLETSIAF